MLRKIDITQASLALTLLLTAIAARTVYSAEDLEREFANPPHASEAWIYWWWLNGYVTEQGIIRDLDEMVEQGISGALVFHAGVGETPKTIEFMSRQWRELFRFAVDEAAKRDITIGLNLCDGWNAGGPWVEAEDAAKMLLHTTTGVTGPTAFNDVLRAPADVDTYHDIAVLAWPIAEPVNHAELTASSCYRTFDPGLAVDGDPQTRWISNGVRPGQGPRPDRPEFLQWDYDRKVPATAIRITPFRHCGPRDCELQVSTDGETYRTIHSFQVDPQQSQTFAFDEVTARRFRLLIRSSHPHRGKDNWNVQISEVMLLEEGGRPAGGIAQCKSRDLCDLTDKMDQAGRLTWQVPEGPWLIVRFGWRVHPRAHTKCTGGERHMEIDPLRALAMDKQFANTAKLAIEEVRAHVGKTFKYLHLDSGEIGEPDWTQTFRADFERLRGYDPFPYLAAKAGHVVDDPETTERFLEDYERTIGDLMIEGYYGRLNELAARYGLGTHSEAAGYQKPTVDALRSLGCNDICMSEFWSRRSQSDPYIHQLAASQLRYHDGIKTASSAAHTYGRKIVQAEAFTVMRQVNYDQAPFDLKDIGDRAFCAGLNRNMLCFFISQPEEQSKPGYVWPGVGMEFDRHVTWWPMSSAWLTYLARCQHLMQTGRHVADVCYLRGEWVPDYVPARWAMNPPLPPGLDCDAVNADALTRRTSVAKDGDLCLPHGQAYKYLVLWQGGRWKRPPRKIFGSPQGKTPAADCPVEGSGNPLAMSPDTLRKLKELVQAGITLVGPRPERAIGLVGYPDSDAEVKALASQLWGERPGSAGQGTVGKGRVIWGRSLAQVMQHDGLLPDLEILEDSNTQTLPSETLSGIPSPGTFDWIHRRIGAADLYFIANLRNAPAAGEFRFRVSGRQPELWDAVTGRTRELPEYKLTDDGRTSLPLEFAPRQSFFVVFRRRATGKASSGIGENFPNLRTVRQIDGPWEVRLDPRWGEPEKVVFHKLRNWTTCSEEGIKYYSGTATYRCTFDLRETPADDRLYLDLGDVHNLARSRLNDADLGVVWTAPPRVEVTGAIRPGVNVLEIEVVNLWWNRLVGDARLPSESRLTTSNASHLFTPDMPLLPSGLLGPVTLRTIDEQPRE